MSEKPELTLILEAALLAADEPISLERLKQVFSEDEDNTFTSDEIVAAIEELKMLCQERSYECVETASGYRFRVKQNYAPWIAKLWELKPARYSRAFLETLVLIAYKQPITRAEIEQVRGVSVSSHIIKSLLDREWIKVVGHKDVPGKPAVLATTKTFLDYFHLKSLDELPALQDLIDLEEAGNQLELKLQEALQSESQGSDNEENTIEAVQSSESIDEVTSIEEG